MSKAKAYENMLQAMSFGIYRGGDKQNLEEINVFLKQMKILQKYRKEFILIKF